MARNWVLLTSGGQEATGTTTVYLEVAGLIPQEAPGASGWTLSKLLAQSTEAISG